ncbi:MAG: endospore germination permease [Oscillospiraceae bacterium]|jgi:spore germination protein (amino acid permease)|nr:endospore germination permease [Oscillospiraceae bacterium]
MPMTNTVNNRQLFYILFLVLTTYDSLTIPYIMARTTGRGGWTTIIAASLIFALAAVVIAKLQNMHKGKMIFDYCTEMLGPVLSYIISAAYIIEYTLLMVYLNSQVFGLIQTEFLTRTPIWATVSLGLAVFGFIAYKGITNVARLFEIIAPLYIISSAFILVLVLTQGDINNVLPLFEPDHIIDYVSALKDMALPFMGLTVITVIPFTSRNKKAPKWAFFGVLFIGANYLINMESSFSLTGINTLMHYKTGVIETFRLVDFPVIERIDILFLTVGYSGMFMGITFIYTAMTEHVCRMFPKIKRHFIVLAIGIIIFIINMFYHDLRRENDAISIVLSIMVTFMSIVLPIFLLIMSKVKKSAQKDN